MISMTYMHTNKSYLWGTKEHAYLFSGSKGTLANILREQGNKTSF